jgi:hypothetical protein
MVYPFTVLLPTDMLILIIILIYLLHGRTDLFIALVCSQAYDITSIAEPSTRSESTANLIIHMLSVDPKWVCPLPMDVASVIPNTGGVKVTPIEANHCKSFSPSFQSIELTARRSRILHLPF